MKTGGWSLVRILGYLFYQSSTNSKTLTQNGQRQKRNCLWASVSFSSCQGNLIKTFQIEAMTALIKKMALVFS